MPIEVKDIEWSQTEQYIVLKVPLKGAATKNVDIFSARNYIKVSFPPYFYEVALYGEIDDDASKATISNGQVIFNLQKCVSETWEQLNSSQHKDKEFMKELRANALEYKQQKEKERTEKLNKEKDQQKKMAVREQMRLDKEEKERIAEIKKKEEEKISQEMDDWKNEANKQKQMPEAREKKGESSKDKFHSAEDMVPESSSNVKLTNGSVKAGVHSAPAPHGNTEEKVKNVPQPRTCGNIQVNFTERVLPTPARESKLPEEEIWLKKLAEMNKIKKATEDATDIEEMNPVWLKDKGDEFSKKGNYIAAINAYTSGLILDSTVPMLYSNRAVCHLALKQYEECIQDCSSALELYDPPVPANLLSRVRAHVRRGTAYCKREQYLAALRDYESASKLDPKNEALKADAYKIRRIIQGRESSD